MDEDFVLVSKEQLERLKKEKKELEEELNNRTNIFSESNASEFGKYLKIMTETLKDESKKEREVIISNLLEIKEINRSTLENVLDRTEKLDKKLENMIVNLIELIETLNTTLEELKGITENHNQSPINSELNPEMLENTQINERVIEKLEEIETFMTNLRVLLSYVKPNDFKIDKPSY